MSKEDKESCEPICYLIAGILLTIFVLIISNHSDSVKWTEARQGMAGWFQFVGTILAIVGTAIVSNNLYRKQLKDQNNDARRIASIHAICLVSPLIEAKGKFESYKKIYPGVPVVTQDQVVTYLNNVISAISFPSNDFAILMAKVDTDCAKAIAITNEALRQIKPHLKRCEKSKYHFSKDKPDPIIELANMIHINVKITCELIEKFLREEGMTVYSGKI